MPATAICWSTYEFFKYIIETRGQEALSSSRIETMTPTMEVFGIVPAVGAASSTAPSSATPLETSVKPRELPAMSGAGMYGSIQYNTIHQQPATVTMQMRRE